MLSIHFVIPLFVFPGSGALSVVRVIGSYAVVYGVSETVLAFGLLSLKHEFETAAAH